MGIKLNKDTFKILYNQIELELSKNEFKLLNMLIKNENRYFNLNPKTNEQLETARNS